jgi:hypothetical protein
MAGANEGKYRAGNFSHLAFLDFHLARRAAACGDNDKDLFQ